MSSIEINKDTYLMWYESMLLMRKFEEKAGQLIRSAKNQRLLPFIHRSGSCFGRGHVCVKKGDSMITAYRDHAHAIAQGVSSNAIMAEFMAKLPDAQKAKAAPCTCLAKSIIFMAGMV
jgi:pyruvate dehydrogenase E1 component alpha subunit